MQSIVLLIVGKVVEILLKYLIAWGEKSIAKQQEIKRKMEEYQNSKTEAVKKAEAYENNPNPDNRNDVP
jgi:hypothetical protein